MNDVAHYHVPVLEQVVAEWLVTDPSGVYLDATIGGGGHALAILSRLKPFSKLFGCDRDPEAIAHCRRTLPPGVALVACRLSELTATLPQVIVGQVSGILMDLGVSSHQIDDPARGFSHRFDGPLDLRMDPQHGQPASELLTQITEIELTRMLRNFGEESQARRIASAILRARNRHAITRTGELAEIISRAVPATHIKSLARVFQALRIAVNNELEELEAGLAQAWALLKSGGRLAVLSYHSLEDRPVKLFMRELAQPAVPLRLPLHSAPPATGRILTRKPITPDADEIARNPRARSAKLRIIEKL
jgi:16S rRNA (cytosine1402-N4)-methyltransferase